MNILIIEDKASVSHGGAEKSMFDYILHLRDLGHNIHLVYDRPGDWLDNGRCELFTSINKVSILPITTQGLINYCLNYFTLLKIIKTYKIDLIFTHVIHGFTFLRLIKIFANVKLAVFFKWIPNTKSIGILGKWGAGAVNAAYSPTKFVADYWSSNGIRPKIGIVPNGIRCNMVNTEVSYHSIKKLLFLGRIYEGKGLHLIIKVLAKLEGLNLYIGGYFDVDKHHEHTEYHKYVCSLIDELNLKARVFFLGEIDNPFEHMNGETLVIVPSIWPENQSRVLLEAMASKTPVIASRIGGLPEVVSQSANEVLFESDEDSLYLKIKDVLKRSFEDQKVVSDILCKRFVTTYEMSATHSALDKLLKVI
jgi:glycosyltransferase involved in cell wall biosynthesis